MKKQKTSVIITHKWNLKSGRDCSANERWAAQPPSRSEPGAAGAVSLGSLSGDLALNRKLLKRYNIGGAFLGHTEYAGKRCNP